jgi:phage terminase large subunit-like protein
VSVNVTTDEVIATRLKKLLIMTRTCGVTRLEGTEKKINLSKQFLVGLNKLLKTNLSRKNSIDQ